jgi:hypothetical protein
MIWIQKYGGIWFKDMSDFIKVSNNHYINYINQYGLPFELINNKDHQKIYFHFLLKE